MALLDTLNIFDTDVFVPVFQVWIEGKPQPPKVLSSIMQISVNQLTNAPSSFSMQINDHDFSMIDGNNALLTEGKHLEIYMGYDPAKTKKMIDGEISAISADLDEGGGLTIQVQGFDALHRASRGTKFRELEQGKDDSQIVYEIAKDLQLGATVSPAVMRQQPRHQIHTSNLECLTALAESNGFSFWVENKCLFFQTHREGPRAVVERGKNLLSFSIRASTAGQVQIMEVIGYDPSTKKLISYSTSIDQAFEYQQKLPQDARQQIKGQENTPSKRVIYAEGGINSVAEAQERADAELIKQRRNLFTTHGSCIGNTEIKPGSPMTVIGMGSRFSHDYLVKTAQHDISQNGYTTSFELSQCL